MTDVLKRNLEIIEIGLRQRFQKTDPQIEDFEKSYEIVERIKNKSVRQAIAQLIGLTHFAKNDVTIKIHKEIADQEKMAAVREPIIKNKETRDEIVIDELSKVSMSLTAMARAKLIMPAVNKRIEALSGERPASFKTPEALRKQISRLQQRRRPIGEPLK